MSASNDNRHSLLQVLDDPQSNYFLVHEALMSFIASNRTRWMNGGEAMFLCNELPVEQVYGPVMKVVKRDDLIDINGFAAVAIGQYGPEARRYLPELLDLLRASRTNCSRAPGLTWAVLQIAPAHSEVLDLVKTIAKEKDSCPHSKEIVQEFLRANDITP